MIHTATLSRQMTNTQYRKIYQIFYEESLGTPWYKNKGYKVNHKAWDSKEETPWDNEAFPSEQIQKYHFSVDGESAKEGIVFLGIVASEGERPAYATMRINLCRLSGGSGGGLYHGTAEEMKLLCQNFHDILFSWSQDEDFSDISKWNVKRIDYTVDINTEYVSEYIEAWRRGDRPHRMKIQEKHEAEYADFTSVYISNGSFGLSVYDKYAERLVNAPSEADQWKNHLRFEVQVLGGCYRDSEGQLKQHGGVNSIKRKVGADNRSILTMAFDDSVLSVVADKMERYFKSTIGMGDIFTTAEVQKELRSRRLQLKKEGAYPKAFEAVERYGSVYDAKQNRKDLNITAIRRELADKHDICLATIPAGMSVNHLPSLYQKLQKELEVFRIG